MWFYLVNSEQIFAAVAQFDSRGECFQRTLNQERAYAKAYLTDDDRAATREAWVHRCNHHRPNTGIGGKSPVERLSLRDPPVKNG